MASKGTNADTRYSTGHQSVADLSASKYRVCRIHGAVVVATATANDVFGILGADVDDYSALAAGQYGVPEIITFGRGTAVAGGVLAADILCKATTAGKLVIAAAGDLAICRTLEAAGADGDEIAVHVQTIQAP
jgi:Flp pilus assembly protein protease CpaA